MKRHGKTKNTGKQRLAAMILAGLASVSSLAYAETDSVEVPMKTLYHNGQPFAELAFFPENVGLGKQGSWYVDAAKYTLSDKLINATTSSGSYWADLLGDGAKNQIPWQIFVTTDESQNASASSYALTSTGTDTKKLSSQSFVMEQIQNGAEYLVLDQDTLVNNYPPAGEYAYSNITVGKYMGAVRDGAEYGWWVDTDTVLPTNEQAADFVGTFRHELGHALGISLESKNIGVGAYGKKSSFVIINPDVTEKSWALHLMDSTGKMAKPGMYFVAPDDTEGSLAKLNEGLAAEGKAILTEDDVFIVNKKVDANGNGYAYFIGDNVTDALGGATFFGRNGVPVNGYEDWKFEGSHLQTAGMMSHRAYSNYTSFMEVELAVMQDLGYIIDRKAYFGKSIYGNGGTITNTQGYFARNDNGTAYLENTYSDVPLGVGLHVYGSNNTVTQAANILTEGTGAVGVRVDGMGNTLVVPETTEIHADGLRGNGILIAYGSGQTVEQTGTVTASGQGGTGVRFDFGSSTNGASDEYRGSYIRFKRRVAEKTGAISSAQNLALTDMNVNQYNAAANELNGAMVDSYNLSGTLVGTDNAIYIGKNAFVKNININEGASVKGNITSDWKQFGTEASEGSYDANGTNVDVLRVQYNGKTEGNGYDYHLYIPDLVTNLNFNADMTYNYNITGEDNMKLNVTGGKLLYGGSADVVGVTVAKEAELYDGSYTLHDMTTSVAADFTLDSTDTGNFINHGTIGASSADTSMSITGNLISDGTLSAYGGGTAGHIDVSGDANVNGSTITVMNALPNENWTALEANSVSGTLANPAGVPYAATGMLNATGAIDGNAVTVSTTAANNLGVTNEVQRQTNDAMVTMHEGLMDAGDTRVNEMRPLFSLDADSAKATLSSLSMNAAAQNMSLTQTSAVTSHIISSRLVEAFATKPMNVNIPVAGLDDGEEKAVTVSMNMPQPVENDFWFKTAKNWGDLNGGAYYHGTTFALGYDRAYGKAWRAGAFVSHGMVSFADTGARNELKDTRLGLYGGYSFGPHEGYVYLDYGWLKNDLSRSIANLGLSPKADYNSRILELGGEYKYDLHAGKMTPWHISPYANVQLSKLWQDGYTESGAGIFGQRVSSATNTYFAGGIGLEAKRYLSNGSYALRLGVKHAFTGADPRLTFGYVGDDASSYEMRNKQDKTHFVMGLNGEAEFASGWWLSVDAALQKGAHDKDVMCALTLRRMW